MDTVKPGGDRDPIWSVQTSSLGPHTFFPYMSWEVLPVLTLWLPFRGPVPRRAGRDPRPWSTISDLSGTLRGIQRFGYEGSDLSPPTTPTTPTRFLVTFSLSLSFGRRLGCRGVAPCRCSPTGLWMYLRSLEGLKTGDLRRALKFFVSIRPPQLWAYSLSLGSLFWHRTFGRVVSRVSDRDGTGTCRTFRVGWHS